jgi:hypothetical protein
MNDDQTRRRDFIKEVITGLAAVEARRAQREHNQQRPDSRP